MKKRFDIHGEFLLVVEGKVLVSRLRGPFNAEFARAYMRAITPIARTLAAAGPWGGITEYRESALFPLEMSATIHNQTIFAATHLQMAANCWVIPPAVEGYGIVDKQARKVYGGVLPFEIFERGADARAWVLQQLKLRQRPDAGRGS